MPRQPTDDRSPASVGAGLRPLQGSTPDVMAAVSTWLREQDPDPLSVRTSGSTGRPKDVVLSRDALIASATATHRRLGGPGRWLLALPAHYVAGLQVVVRSHLAGVDPVVLDDYPEAADALRVLVETPGRSYAALVPTQLGRWLDDPPTADLLRLLDGVLIGGSALRDDLARRARESGATVVATYGMSETCGGCVYDGVPLDGVAVAIGADGRIRLSGPVLFDGYDSDPELTAQSLVDGWYVTPDLGDLDLDGRLTVTGRADDMVVTGGVNVPLPAVQAAVRDVPGVADALVLGLDDPEWGSRVSALVVGDGSVTRDVVRDAVASRHPRAWAPQQVLVATEIPMLDTGKPDRSRARALLEAAHG